MAATDEDYAIIIGIDRYESLNKLDGAAADARDFERWVREKAKVPEGHIEVLADPDEHRPMAEIKDKFVQLFHKSDGGQKRLGRRLYIFLAGHGTGTDIDRTAIFASDHYDYTPNALSATGIANVFVRVAIFDEVILFMDCCRSFDGKIEVHNPFNPEVFDPDARSVKRCYAYAAKLDQKAREKKFEEGIRGLFTMALVTGLDGRAADPKNNHITVKSLAKYVKKKMEELGAKRQNAEFDPDDNIVLLDTVAFPTTLVTVRLSEPDRGFVVYHGADISTPLDVERTQIDEKTCQVSLRSYAQYLFAVLDENEDWDVSSRKTVRDTPVEIEL